MVVLMADGVAVVMVVVEEEINNKGRRVVAIPVAEAAAAEEEGEEVAVMGRHHRDRLHSNSNNSVSKVSLLHLRLGSLSVTSRHIFLDRPVLLKTLTNVSWSC